MWPRRFDVLDDASEAQLQNDISLGCCSTVKDPNEALRPRIGDRHRVAADRTFKEGCGERSASATCMRAWVGRGGGIDGSIAVLCGRARHRGATDTSSRSKAR